MNAEPTQPARPLVHATTIARFTLLEAVRTRLPWIWAGVLAFFAAASLFINQIAITESGRLQWSFYASGLRLAAVLTLAAYITSSMVRELSEKGMEMVLALDLPRGSYVAGKLLAFVGIAAAMAVSAAAPIALGRPWAAVGGWMLSLGCELSIVAAFALFCVVSFSQVVPAMLLVIAFYLLSRTIDALRLMAESSVLDELSGARSVFEYAFDAIALLLPALDRFTLTEWIASGAIDDFALVSIGAQTLIYTLLLFGASLIDFHRREL